MSHNLHPIFQLALSPFMPGNNIELVKTVYDDPVERAKILEHRREEYDAGFDDIDSLDDIPDEE